MSIDLHVAQTDFNATGINLFIPTGVGFCVLKETNFTKPNKCIYFKNLLTHY